MSIIIKPLSHMAEKKAFSKSEIILMYPGVPRRELLRYVNEIISDNRKRLIQDDQQPELFCNKVKVLFPIEFERLKAIVGEPIKDLYGKK